MNWITMMSGPLNALTRYAATAAGGFLLSRGYLDASAAQAVSGAIIAVAPAIIGALTATKAAQIKTVKAIPGVAVVPDNTVPLSPSVNSAMNDR